MSRLDETLRDHLLERTMTPIETCRFGVKMLNHLEKLHALGYIYNDLKLDNICMDEKGDPYLIDFGFCTRFQDSKGKHLPLEKANF